jgi:hypothetical protein
VSRNASTRGGNRAMSQARAARPAPAPARVPSLPAEPSRLCRLEYLGSTDVWAFAFYKCSDEAYERSIFPSGSFAGSLEAAFDCAGNVYLQS